MKVIPSLHSARKTYERQEQGGRYTLTIACTVKTQELDCLNSTTIYSLTKLNDARGTLSHKKKKNRVDSGWAEMATSAQRNLLLKVVTASKDTLAYIIVEENVDVAHTAHRHNLDMKAYAACALGKIGRDGPNGLVPANKLTFKLARRCRNGF